MSVKSFLKTLGLDALKAAQVGTQVIPFLQPFSFLIPKYGPQVSAAEGMALQKLDAMQVLFNDVQKVEQVTAIITSGAPGAGAAKAQAVAVGLPAILTDIELLGGSKLGSKWTSLSDDEKVAFNAAAQRMAGAAADMLNILKV